MTTTIVTHSRNFNLDEIAAISLLKIFKEDEYEIVRTRDEKLLKEYKDNENVFVIDVGLEYDDKKLNFDHHQNEMTLVWDNDIPYSSCGLIWKWLKDNDYLDELSNNQKMKIETSFIKKVDAQDNGVKLFPEMTFVSKSNRNHHDDKVIDGHFLRTQKVVQAQLEMLIENVKNNVKQPLPSSSNISLFTDYLMTSSLMKNYGFTNDFKMNTTDNKLNFSFLNKEGEEESFYYDLNKKEFKDIDGSIEKIEGTLTAHAWQKITNNPNISQLMNEETIALLEEKLINYFIHDFMLPTEFVFVTNYEKAGKEQKEAFKAMNMILLNTYADVRNELKHNKDIEKYIRKSKDYDGIVLCERNLKKAPDKIRKDCPDKKILILPRDKKSWKIQSLTKGHKHNIFPKEWYGLSGKKLEKVSGHSNFIFCHKTGFMLMINGTKEDALKLAQSLIQQPKIKNEKENIIIKKKRKFK